MLFNTIKAACNMDQLGRAIIIVYVQEHARTARLSTANISFVLSILASDSKVAITLSPHSG